MIWLFVIPLVGSIVTFFMRNKALTIAISLIPLILLAKGVEDVHYAWFPPLSIEFALKTDPLSLVFLVLTLLVIPISLVVAKPNTYSLILLLEGLLIGFFTSRDLVFFTIFWEAMLLPLYFLINLGNKPDKQFASLQFILYMLAGSILMVAALLFIYLEAKTFNFYQLERFPEVPWIFAIFALAFAVKTPLFPFHAWLPDAYDQAPTSGTILLSALLSKAGIYGFLRIGLELFPKTFALYQPPLLILAIIGALYGGMAAYKQNNFKRLFAYSSFSHVNFILAGVFALNEAGKVGAIVQAFNHGVIITGLFLVSGWLEMRLNSTSIFSAGGLAKFFPKLTWLTFTFILASIALPGTSGFIGELLILFGIFIQSFWSAAFLTLSVIISVVYMLRFMQTVYFQTPHLIPLNQNDISKRNLLISLPLLLLIFWIGIYPSPLISLLSKEPL